MISDEVAEQLIDFLDIKFTKYIPHSPSSPQHSFLWLECLEALYGGAAGGGKSDAMLMAALQYVDDPSYSALIMRRTFSELSLEGALLSRATEWLGHTDASWNGNDMKWRFPSGAVLQFGYMTGEKDRARYQSAEFQFIGIDELTDWSENDYRFMFSRLRKGAGSGIPLRMRTASNPGGRGHDWVKQRFLKEGSVDRVFIPAKLSDNEYVDQEAYLFALEQLDPEQRQMLLMGDWDARAPGNWVIGDPHWVDLAVELGERMWHNGLPAPVTGGLQTGTDWGEVTQSYVVWELADGGIYVPPSEVKRQHVDPTITSHDIIRSALQFQYPWTTARFDAAGVQPMRVMMGIARRMPGLGRLRSQKIPFNMYKRETMGYMRTLFRRTAEERDTRFIAIHPDNEELIRQLKVWERKNEESDEAVKVDDHGPDALLAGIAPVAKRYRAYVEELFRKSHGETDNIYDVRRQHIEEFNHG